MRNPDTKVDSPAAMAHVLAMVMATHSALDPNDIRMLESLDAFDSIGMSKARFLRVAERYRRGPCWALSGHRWLTLDDLAVIDAILDPIHDIRHRLLLCRIAGCIITADGRVEPIEHQIYDHMLLRWGHTASSLAQAILVEHVHRPAGQRERRLGV